MVKTCICKHKCDAFCFFFPLFGGKKHVTLVSLIYTHSHKLIQIYSTHTHTHTHSYSLIHTFMSAHCLPPRNITGTAPVGAIYRSNTAEFQQISDPDLQLPLRPTGTSPNLFFAKRMRDIVTL